MVIAAECSLISYITSLGYGKHTWDFPLQNLGAFALAVNVTGTLLVTAAIWSKTSFAFTILRLSEGWMRILVLFLIISMNIAMGVSALLPWVACRPLDKAWSPMLPGECWPGTTVIHYNMFSGGRCSTLLRRQHSEAHN